MMGVDLDRVWRIAHNLVEYPRFMEQVLSVEPCDVPGADSATAWVVLFNGNELRWTEIDNYDHHLKRMTFEQYEGDLYQWYGAFSACAEGGCVTASYEINFDLGVPSLAHLLHPLGERAIAANCAQMLEEIELRSQHLSDA